jgi:type II secretory pathway component PulF
MAIEISSAATAKATEATDKLGGNTAARKRARWNIQIGGTPAVTNKQRQLFTEQLALLLETGVPLHAALKTTRDQVADEPGMHAVISQLYDDVTNGKPLSFALAKHPAVFSGTYSSLIGAAEQGGFMADVLKALVETEEKSDQMRSTIVSALSYPAFLMAFSLGVVVFVLVAVFPKFAELFAGIRDQLPITTIYLMKASEVMRNQWYIVVPGFVAALALIVFWFRSAAGVAARDRAVLTIPVVKDIAAQIYLTQTLRVLGLSLSHGVPVVEGLASCRGVVRNAGFRQVIERVEAYVTEGKGIALGFNQSKIIPSLAKQMITTGEETGTLAFVMKRIAEYYERELTKKIGLLSKLAEPVMLLIMGAVVGVLVSSLILPIFKLSKVAH